MALCEIFNRFLWLVDHGFLPVSFASANIALLRSKERISKEFALLPSSAPMAQG